MTSHNGIAARDGDINSSRKTNEGLPSDLLRAAFVLNANQNLVFWRVVALRHSNPDMQIRAADLQGAGPGASVIEKALADLTRKAPGEPGRLVRSRAQGYLPEVDPWPYVQRDLQFAAGCKPNAPQEAREDVDPANQPGDPLAAVKAFELAARVSLRARKWEEQAIHGFHFARREATKGELIETMEWIVANWRRILKGREFAPLWEDEDDDDGFSVRQRSRVPAVPEPQFIGRYAHLFWSAWDRHVRQQRVWAEQEAKRRAEQEAQAIQYANDLRAATEAGLSVEEWRRQQIEARDRESRRRLEESRARNPTYQALVASAARREQEAMRQAASPTLPATSAPPIAAIPEAPKAHSPNQPRWEGEMRPFPIIRLPTWEEVCPPWKGEGADQTGGEEK
jgi:hypothetical protein